MYLQSGFGSVACHYRQHCVQRVKRQFNSYSDGDFEVFRPAGSTHCTDGGKIWHEGVDLPRVKFHPHRCNDKGIQSTKLKILLRFCQNSEYKCPSVAYPLHDFHEICMVYIPFHSVLGFKIWMDLLKGLQIYGRVKLRGSSFLLIFSAP